MTIIKIKTGKNEIVREIPDSIDEISLKLFLSLNEAYSERNSRKILATWLNVTLDEIDAIPSNKLDIIQKSVSWYDNKSAIFIIQSILPESIKTDSTLIKVPNTYNFEDSVSIGQFMAFDDLRTKCPLHIAAIAAYLSPKMISNGKYIDEFEKQYISQAEKIPAYLAYPISIFFLKCRKERMPTFQKLISQPTKTLSWLGYPLLASLAFLMLLTIWLVVM